MSRHLTLFFRVVVCGACLIFVSACHQPAGTGAGGNAAGDGVNLSGPPSKLGLCAGCHGVNGRAILPIYPNLNGQNQPYLEKSLRAYKSGERQSAEMRSMVGTLTEDEIVALSAYYSAQ